MKNKANINNKLLIGWEEWCRLPLLAIPAIKAKIDTGAKTTSLHAFDIKPFDWNGVKYVSFLIHPLQGEEKITIRCVHKVVDKRYVMSSNGHKEKRFVIRTPLILGKQKWDIEITLSNRDPLRFRMLLGREALRNKVIIDPHRSMCQGKFNSTQIQEIYQPQILNISTASLN